MANANQVVEGGMTRPNIGPLSTLESFDLRNGEIGDAINMICKAAIPASFRWVYVEGLPSNRSIAHADVFIKCAMVQMMRHNVTIVDAATTKKVAIILGVARATMTEMYRLERGDLIAGEVADDVVSYGTVAGPNGVPAVTWTPADGLSVDNRAYVMGNLELDDTEKAVMADLVALSIGIPPLQGASIMACGHHYLSDPREKSRPFYKVVENQFWKTEPSKTWFATNPDELKDALWHKAGHPIAMNLKLRWAISSDIAAKIRIAGAGSAASRLPAKESELKAAETVVTLVKNVRQFFKQYGGKLSCRYLQEVIDLVNTFVPGIPFDEAHPDHVLMPGVPAEFEMPVGTPIWVKDRSTALRFLKDVVDRNADITATAFGFFETYCANAMSGTGGADEITLAKSNYLGKLKDTCFSAYAKGMEAYGDYKTYKAAERAAGRFTPPKMSYE